ncbi:hypothetical protein BHE74_00006885 [Ensete ventricosum]|nr:hypothetical protein GW17_00036951 [Ensete ventricosum]RWW84493.1 hypothetical protein BHE74_00006885 [Ensete ventricosum]
MLADIEASLSSRFLCSLSVFRTALQRPHLKKAATLGTAYSLGDVSRGCGCPKGGRALGLWLRHTSVSSASRRGSCGLQPGSATRGRRSEPRRSFAAGKVSRSICLPFHGRRSTLDRYQKTLRRKKPPVLVSPKGDSKKSLSPPLPPAPTSTHGGGDKLNPLPVDVQAREGWRSGAGERKAPLACASPDNPPPPRRRPGRPPADRGLGRRGAEPPQRYVGCPLRARARGDLQPRIRRRAARLRGDYSAHA